MDSLSIVYNWHVSSLPLHLCRYPQVIVCICNGLRDEDIKNMCDSCETKKEFADCVKKKMCERSCLTCYGQLIEHFQKEKNV